MTKKTPTLSSAEEYRRGYTDFRDAAISNLGELSTALEDLDSHASAVISWIVQTLYSYESPE